MDCMKDKFVEGLVLDGRFESISPLNHGSFGMVFLAKDLTKGGFVAIKCSSKVTTSDDCSAASGDAHLIELACHNLLGSHPNIVNLIHSFETDAHVYLVLEFCSKGDLYEAIRLGQGPLETENVREFMLQLVGAVDYMHSKGLYHRDIKPENIFLAQDGTMKLGDFGLATTESHCYDASVGSDRYMSPEQYDPAENGYSPAEADTWAVGICLLNILFSRNPFVTPNESDVLFADFTRDSQSLFDIFPNMSQDTFEVLVHAMAIDPTKRSLAAVREKLQQVVSFTTDEEVLDDFCNEDREVVPASANREPLRTPSIQSPQVDNGGAFPWAKALQMSPQRRQLSVIPDNESYTEDLFPASEKDRDSWYSLAEHTSSFASGLDSTFAASIKSMALHQPVAGNAPRTDPAPVSSSLPTKVSKPLPALSSVFGKDTSVSKSWTDLWDEDEEEFMENEKALQQRREYNSRSWSMESKDSDPTLRRTPLSELKISSTVNSRTNSPGHDQAGDTMDGANDVIDNDHFVFEDVVPPPPRYSPPSKRTIMDKWAALGNRRRAFHQSADTAPDNTTSKKRGNTGNWRGGLGLKVWSGNVGFGVWDRDRKENSVGNSHTKVQDWRRDTRKMRSTERVIAGEDSSGDHEWVGGWHDLHL